MALRVAFWGLIFSAIVLVVLIPIQRKVVQKEAILQGQELAEAIYGMYETVDRNAEIEKAGSLLLRVSKVPDVAYVAVLSHNGKILYANHKDLVGKKKNLFKGARYRNGLLLVNHVVEGMSSEIAGVQVAIDMSSVFRDLNTLQFQMGIGLLLVVLLLAVLVAVVMERLVGRRLIRLVDAMGNAERGSFLVRAQVDHSDEVGNAASGFNKLLEALTNMQVREIEREHDLQAVVEKLSIKEKFERVAKELSRTNEDLGRRMKAQDLLMRAAHQLGGTLDKDAIVDRLALLLRENLSWKDFAIFVTQKKTNTLPKLVLATANGAPNIEIMRRLELGFGEGITGMVAETGQPLMVPDLSVESRIKLRSYLNDSQSTPQFLEQGSLLAVPMLYQGRVTGVMDFFSPNRRAFDADEIALLSALGAQAAMAIVNADLYSVTLNLARLDPLTNVMNRRAMEERIESEIARSQRFGTPLSLLMLDVDCFKAYNDNMGHVLGDAALKAVAKSLKRSIRKVDGLARFGGEEFCVILPQADTESAREVAVKLRNVIRAIEIPGSKQQPLGHMSVSIGIAVYPNDMPQVVERSPLVELVHAADEALYVAKRRGRDRYLFYKEVRGEK